MFFGKANEILIVALDNRLDMQASRINGGVRFSIFNNTIDFSR